METRTLDGDQFRFSVTIPIRFADIDAQRHLNNVAYFTFMEQARVEYFMGLGIWKGDAFDSAGIIVAEANCTYKAPAFLDDMVTVWTRVSYLGEKSFHFEYRLTTERGEIANGKTVQVCYDYGQRRTISMPTHWRETILSFEPALSLGSPPPR